jgi:prepilin-type N-terminal cleavage/methylation domain-containing protein
MKKLKNCSGVTLIEILIGIVISVIIMAAMYTSYQAINGSYSQVTGKAKASQTGRNVLGMLMRDLRQAGFKFFEDNIINDDQPISITKNRGELNASQVSVCDHIQIVYGDASLDVNQNPVYERYRVTYFCRRSTLRDPNGNLEDTRAIFKQKEEWSNNAWVTNEDNSYPEQLITDYIDDLTLIAKDINGRTINPPPRAGNANRLRVYDIRAVEIKLTTRSRDNFYQTNLNADGMQRTIFDIDSDNETTITDRFLRETSVMSVSIRNLGLQ